MSRLAAVTWCACVFELDDLTQRMNQPHLVLPPLHGKERLPSRYSSTTYQAFWRLSFQYVHQVWWQHDWFSINLTQWICLAKGNSGLTKERVCCAPQQTRSFLCYELSMPTNEHFPEMKRNTAWQESNDGLPMTWQWWFWGTVQLWEETATRTAL